MSDTQNNTGFSSSSCKVWWHFVKPSLKFGAVVSVIIITLLILFKGPSTLVSFYSSWPGAFAIGFVAFMPLMRTLEWLGLPDIYFEGTAEFLDFLDIRERQWLDDDADGTSEADDDFDFDP